MGSHTASMWRLLVPLLPWFVFFGLALLLDGTVADAVHDRGIAAALRRHPLLLGAWKSPGEFWFTAAVVAAGWLVGRLTDRKAVFVLLAGALSGLNVVPKWIVGRTRPFKLAAETAARPWDLQPFRHGLTGFLHQQNLSFPSGHECTAFALALSMLCVAPRAAVPLMMLAAAVGVERVLENAHYCSDVLGAIPVAALGVALSWKFTMRTASTVPMI